MFTGVEIKEPATQSPILSKNILRNKGEIKALSISWRKIKIVCFDRLNLKTNKTKLKYVF